ncbi:MAG: transglycosylase SLT domain-containing protein [Candidatus Hydrogenedentales bacterium]
MSPFILVGTLLLSTLPGAESYVAARTAENQTRYGDAFKAYEECAKVDGPLNAFARVRKAALRGKANDTAGAMAELQPFADAAGDDPATKMAKAELAKLLQAAGRPADAAKLIWDIAWSQVPSRWVDQYRLMLADCLAASDDSKQMGFNLYAQMLAEARNPRTRLELAQKLAASPDVQHRLEAATAMVTAGEFGQAGAVVLTLAPMMGDADPERAAQYAYLKGRVMLAAGDTEPGRAGLREVAAASGNTTWGRLAAAHVARSLYRAKETEAALQAFDQLVRDFPRTEETSEALWWLAGRYAEEEKTDEAIVEYLRLAKTCPKQERADDALIEAAEGYRRKNEFKKAGEMCARLLEHYPRSPLASAACYDSGLMHEKLKNVKAAKADYVKATLRGIGDYYAHRAMEKLYELRDNPGAGGSTLHGLEAFVRPIELPIKASPDANKTFREEPWSERLFFFADHGFEEAEWEALSLLAKPEQSGGQMAVCLALSEAGLAATANQIAERGKLGIANGVPTPERLRVQYPRAYWSQVCEVATETGVDPYLLLAIGRQESVFQPRVVSRSGATGVMQLMPGTADWLMKVEPGVQNEHADNLSHPANSLRLGAYYLMRMIDRNDGNLVFALASYNAGPGNVSKWRKSHPSTDMEAFIDFIPFSETKDYVKKVLGNYAAYHSLYPEQERVAAAK